MKLFQMDIILRRMRDICPSFAYESSFLLLFVSLGFDIINNSQGRLFWTKWNSISVESHWANHCHIITWELLNPWKSLLKTVDATADLKVTLHYGSLTGQMSSRFTQWFPLGRSHSGQAIWKRIKKNVAAAREELLALRDARYDALIQVMSGRLMACDHHRSHSRQLDFTKASEQL